MPDITPITDEDELRREAAASAPQFAPLPQPSSAPTTPNQDGIDQAPSAEPAPQTLEQPRNRRVFEGRQVHQAPEQLVDPLAPFSYRKPAFSYTLVWLWSFAAIIISILLLSNINLIIKANNLRNAAPTNSLFAGSRDRQSKGTEEMYNTTIWPQTIALVLCVGTIGCLLSGRKVFRYIGILISLGIIVYVLYIVFKDFKFESSSGLSSGTEPTTDYQKALADFWIAGIIQGFANSYAAYVPFTILPITTVVYLLGSKAGQSYE